MSTTSAANAEYLAMSARLLDDSVNGLPLRPRFIKECVLIPRADGFLVDGGVEPRVILAGKAKTSLLYLIRLLDGTKTLSDLSAALPGVPLDDLKNALHLLSQLGLLEEGSVDPLQTRNDSEAITYFRRFAQVNKRNHTGVEAFNRLQQIRISLVSPDQESQSASWLQDILLRSGVRSVALLSLGEMERSASRSAADRQLVLSFSLTGEQHEWHMRLSALCSSRNLPWVRFVMDREGNFADIGPLFNHRPGPCYECFWKVHGQSSSADRLPSIPETGLFVGLLATEILYAFSEIASSGLLKGFIRYRIEPYRSQLLQVSRLPACGACGLRPATGQNEALPVNDALVDASILYEEYVGNATRLQVFLEPQSGKEEIYRRLTREFKILPNCRQLTLPNHEYRASQDALLLLHRSIPTPVTAVSIDRLSLLLKISAGIRSDHGKPSKCQRWAPTGGNLGSVELYVVALNVLDLEAGIYFYQALDHRLASFQRLHGALSPLELAARSTRLQGKAVPDALIIMTGAYHRVSRKYGPFGYRLINFDAGVAVTQLMVAAASLGMRARLADRWADDLIEKQLGLTCPDEQCTAVVALFAADSPISATSMHYAGTAGQSAMLPRAYCGKPLHEILELLYRSSRLKEEELDNQTEPSHPCAAPLASNGISTSLPDSVACGRPIDSILSERVSVREYSSASVTLGELGTILRCGCEVDPQWASPCNLSLSVLALRVEGLDRGLHFYASDEKALYFQVPAPEDSILRRLFVQPSLSTAPAIVLITGNLASATSRLGSYGHRLLLLRAGVVAQRLWIAAMAVGFGGVIAAGIVRPIAQKHLFMDGNCAAPLLAFAFGVPAADKE